VNCEKKPIKPLKLIKVLNDASYEKKENNIRREKIVQLLARDARDNMFILKYTVLYIEIDGSEDNGFVKTDVRAEYVICEPNIRGIEASELIRYLDWKKSSLLYKKTIVGYALDDFLMYDEYIDWLDFINRDALLNNYNLVDLHIHTDNSDGTDSIWPLTFHLKNNGVTIFSVTDHDSVAFYKKIKSEKKLLSHRALGGLRLIPGIEFSCKTEFGKCHILGYGIDIDDVILTNTIMMTAALRNKKMINRISFLEKEYGIILDDEDKEYLAKQNSVGKPHLARVLVNKGLAEDINTAIIKFLNNIPRDEDDRIDAKMAIDAITHAGGIPIWAHPLGGEGEKRLSEDELCNQMQCLLDKGIKGIEFYYSRYSAEDRKIIKNAMFKTNSTSKLLLSGGSDYHGNVKNIMPGELCSDDRCILGNQLSVLTKLDFEDNRHEICTLEQTRFLCNKVVFALGKKVNSMLNDKDIHKANRNRYEFIHSVFKNSHMFCERKFCEANIEGKWYYSENGMINVSLCEDKDYGLVTQTKVTRLTDKFINDIVSAFEETLGYRPKYETQNIMNVVQTITLTDD